ncbi:MAG: tetratricopeptide repeat protein [Acetobacter sp.]|uniref:tetratricopeptide repeat protein n=1 Tax=Acetobacter sp. TaxID=440 RepID=UPI0039E916A3
MKTTLSTKEITKIGNKLKTLSQKNNYKETIKEIKNSIRKHPRWADGYSLLGDIYTSISHYEESYSAYSKALELDPDNLQWKLSLLLSQLEMGRNVDLALNELLNLFIKNVEDEDICIKIASIMVSGKHPKITIAAIKWRAQNYKNGDVLSSILANQLLEAGLISEGCEIYLDLFRSSPNGILYAPQLGVALIRIGAFQTCADIVESLKKTSPDTASLMLNEYGIALAGLNRSKEAQVALREYLHTHPESQTAKFNLGQALLKDGKYEEGWKLIEFSPAEFKVQGVNNPWKGDFSINGKTLLVYGEQGFGDMLQFLRYIPYIEKLGANIVLSVPENLKRLCQASFPDINVTETDLKEIKYDYSCSLLSLPLALSSQIGHEIPSLIPYLYPNQSDIEKFSKILGKKNKLRVGLVWSGENRPRHGLNYKNRSASLKMFSKIIDVENIDFVSLQLGNPQKELLQWDGKEIFDPMNDVSDMEDTAALVFNLDLIISVDTSIAHLAGALGKPVWMITRSDCCWRWLENREDTPWYPTMKIFRSQPGSLRHAIDLVAISLPDFVTTWQQHSLLKGMSS